MQAARSLPPQQPRGLLVVASSSPQGADQIFRVHKTRSREFRMTEAARQKTLRVPEERGVQEMLGCDGKLVVPELLRLCQLPRHCLACRSQGSRPSTSAWCHEVLLHGDLQCHGHGCEMCSFFFPIIPFLGLYKARWMSWLEKIVAGSEVSDPCRMVSDPPNTSVRNNIQITTGGGKTPWHCAGY